MKLKKLTTKQLTEVVNSQHMQIRSLLGLINTYIEFNGHTKEFGVKLKEKYGQSKEAPSKD